MTDPVLLSQYVLGVKWQAYLLGFGSGMWLGIFLTCALRWWEQRGRA